MRFEVYQSLGQWRWRLVAANNRIIAHGGESFHNKQDAVDSVDLVRSADDSVAIHYTDE